MHIAPHPNKTSSLAAADGELSIATLKFVWVPKQMDVDGAKMFPNKQWIKTQRLI
jgi:hypothetical protein